MRLAMVAVSLFILSCVFVGCDNSGTSENSKDGKSVVPATWATQLDTALSAARKVDPDVVLRKLVAEPKGDLNREGKYETLKVSFFFVQPGGHPITMTTDSPTPEVTFPETEVIFADTAPTTTLEVDPLYDYISFLPSAKEREQIMTALMSVKISPADVLRKTIEQGRKYSEQRNTDVFPSIRLELTNNVPANFGRPAVWNIFYQTREKDLLITLDAQTGEVLEQKEH